MGRYIIKFDRIGCISDAACTAVHPERWIMNNMDGRSVLIGGTESGKGVFEVECDETEIEKFVKAACVCPVGIIKITDKKTGKPIQK
ncbi:MAG: ferredoxin [Candidatus Doudnabacteria bacterium]|nr:ferredoxin [Candidatus Doudnabacteria bacterium]